MIKNNCKGCTERIIGCHSTCQSYLVFAEDCERVRENRRNESTYNRYLMECNDKARRIYYRKAGR
jgi:hypothetical protein